MRQVAVFSVLAIGIGVAGIAMGGEETNRNGSTSKPELVLQYDFLPDQGTKITDFSGKKHDGTLQNGEVVEGRRKNAIKFDGKGMIAVANVLESLNPASRPLTIGAFCKPSSPDGVVVAMGDKSNGFSLYLKGGVAQFAVRAQGELWKVTAPEPLVMDQWVHLAGAIDGQGKMWLIVNGWPGTSVEGRLVPGTPSEPFSIGADTGSFVGDYTTAMHWHGLVQDIRLYWGFIDRNENRDEWGDWADLPGCGCKK